MASPAGQYFVSTAPGLLDLDFICAALRGSYWASTRTRAVTKKSLRKSLCFGIYTKRGRRQVAFARVVTDEATFSWLCDVIVDEKERGKGLGKLLVSSVVAHPRIRHSTFILRTRDAHGLYRKFGFVPCPMMRKPGSARGKR